MAPAMAQAPSTTTNGGQQNLNDQFITPLEAPNLPPETLYYQIVSDAYLIPHHVYQLPPITQQIPKPEHRQSGGLQSGNAGEFKRYLASIAGDLYEKASAIITAESGWHPNAHNPNSTASGLAQYLTSTFQSQCINLRHLAIDISQKNDPYIQMDCLVSMLKDGGDSHWNASRHIWDKK